MPFAVSAVDLDTILYGSVRSSFSIEFEFGSQLICMSAVVGHSRHMQICGGSISLQKWAYVNREREMQIGCGTNSNSTEKL